MILDMMEARRLSCGMLRLAVPPAVPLEHVKAWWAYEDFPPSKFNQRLRLK
jgi:hypothetical protein